MNMQERVSELHAWQMTNGSLYFPDAAKTVPPSDDEKAILDTLSVERDYMGRPLHPELHRVFGERGLRFGKGEFWRWGPNYTVDPVIIATEASAPNDHDDRVLTIVRRSNGKRALPGGFVDLIDDTYENPRTAAVREAAEETGLDISDDPHQVIFDGPVRDDRETLNAWPHTTAILFRHKSFSPVTAGDDAEPGSAEWLRLDEIDFDTLHGSHAELIRLGFEVVRAARLS